MRAGRRGARRRHGLSGVARILEPSLLLLLQRGAAHGYTLMARLGDFGVCAMNPTAVYRALRDMEARGWVVSHWEDQETQGPPRRIYEMTDLGDEALRAWSEDLERTRDTIDGLLRAYRGRRSGGNSRDSD